MRARLFFVLASVIIAAHLCHYQVLWADDNLPLAAAMQVAHGQTLYRDVWFDKPPLVAWIDLLWGAHYGILLRLAGAIYAILCADIAYKVARAKWSNREAIFAAVFTAFFLTFGLASAVLPLASDMLLILPQFLAIYLATRGRPFSSGIAAGVGLLCSAKAILLLPICLLWQKRRSPLAILGFTIPGAIALEWMILHGSASEYFRQVWQWGAIYSANTFIGHPVIEGLKRSADWLGFHAALAIGAIIMLTREKTDRWRTIFWIAIASFGIVLGLRFFPRYYFLLLPPLTIAAARGWSLIWNRRIAQVALVILLAIPLVRFAPRYITVALNQPWHDLDIDRDSQAAAQKLRALSKPGDSLFVWGFRPDIFVYSQLPAGTRFLESQPISGVLADRHLFSTQSISADFIESNRKELTQSQPTWIVDGLGLYNPSLALASQPYLAPWFANYVEVDRTSFSILYHLR